MGVLTTAFFVGGIRNSRKEEVLTVFSEVIAEVATATRWGGMLMSNGRLIHTGQFVLRIVTTSQDAHDVVSLENFVAQYTYAMARHRVGAPREPLPSR